MMPAGINAIDFYYLLPEIVLSIGASFLLIAPVLGFRTSHRSARVAMFVVLGLTLLSVIYASNAVEGLTQSSAFHSMFVLDRFAVFFKVLFIVAETRTASLSELRSCQFQMLIFIAFAALVGARTTASRSSAVRLPPEKAIPMAVPGAGSERRMRLMSARA